MCDPVHPDTIRHMHDTVTIIERLPTVEEYQTLRQAVGWPAVDGSVVASGLENTLCSVCAVEENAIVGCGRVLGDGGIYFYLQDVIVLPTHQRLGIGRRITDLLMGYVSRHAGHNSFVGLMAAAGVAPFYEAFGFAVRPADRPGMFLMWPLQQDA